MLAQTGDIGPSLANFGVALAAFLVAVGVAAPIVTKAVDLVRNLIDRDDDMPRATWNILAFAFGVGIAVLFQFNVALPLLKALPALAAQAERLDGTWGQVFTGLGIGAVASGWHEKFAEMSARSKIVGRTTVVDDR